MGRVYATAADYLEVIGEAGPDDLDRRLARASEQVELAIMSAVYPVDTAGMPTEPEHVDAMRKATCACVKWWIETGDELGDAGQWTSVGIGSTSLTRAQPVNAGSPAQRIGDQARVFLRIGRLLSPGPAGY